LTYLDGRIDFYAVFESLVHQIIEEGGLETTLLIYKVTFEETKKKDFLKFINSIQ
jgi:hypothetical protein